MQKKVALITGITGQDGSYLADFLLAKEYEVHSIVRQETLENHTKLKNIQHILDSVILHEGSLTDYSTIYKIFSTIRFDECYHLSAFSFVNYSFDDEFLIMQNNINTTHHLLSVIKTVQPQCKFFYAGSSEMFGEPSTLPQTESTPFNPKSIYGISKVTGYFLLKNYRDKEHLFAATGIMYNHESSRRANQFVTKKIISAAVKIKLGLQKKLFLGNLDAKRDWGYAPDYVEAMWRILQLTHADDFVIASGKLHTVREFLDITFSYLGLNYLEFVEVDEKFFRPSETIPLCGNTCKLQQSTGWKSTKSLNDIIIEMIEAELLSYNQKGKIEWDIKLH